jgi:hypothetical protein
VTNGVDYWRDLYAVFWCLACADRLVRGHVRLCSLGGSYGRGWCISACVYAAILEKQAAFPLGDAVGENPLPSMPRRFAEWRASTDLAELVHRGEI